MSTREDAKAFLAELYASIPQSFYNELELMQRGFCFVLDYLEKADGEVIAGDLAPKMHVSTPRVATLLKRMEQSGYITRRTSSQDARRSIIEITPAGIAHVNDMREQALSKAELLLDQINKDDLYTFIKVSHQIREAMKE